MASHADECMQCYIAQWFSNLSFCGTLHTLKFTENGRVSAYVGYIYLFIYLL